MKTVIICGIEVSYILKRSKRRSISASVNKDGLLEVRAPFGVSDDFVREFLVSKGDRILLMMEKSASRREYENDLGNTGLAALREMAKAVIPERVRYFSEIMGVRPARVRINAAKTRFGSCSGKGNLNFSCRVMAYSANAVDYVVIHELSHLLHMDHSPEFWRTVEKYMPDYRDAKAELKQIPKIK